MDYILIDNDMLKLFYVYFSFSIGGPIENRWKILLSSLNRIVLKE